MIVGELYNANHPDLVDERTRIHNIIFEYNRLAPSEKELRNDMIRKIFGKTGAEFHICSDFKCDYGYNIYLGQNFFANFGCVILDEAPVRFGDNVLLAPNVSIYTAGHPFDLEQRNAAIEYALPVTIGNNVWIGGNVTIVPGVSIGDNSVIGAGSVVTKDIPSNVVAVGNPCRVIKKI